MRRLILLPVKPYYDNGYSIAVKSDLDKLQPSANDLLIWYDDVDGSLYGYDKVIKRPSKYSLLRVINVLKNNVNCELQTKKLKNEVLTNVYDEIFCGDVIFYNAVRSLFPNKKITVRFHNCFSRIKDRIRLINEPVNLKFKIQARAFYKLEKKIFHDSNVYKIFISDEDRLYYTMNFGKKSDSCVWGFTPDMNKAVSKRSEAQKTKIVHVGGLQTHKIDGIIWFINEVFLPLRNTYPTLEFHMWGQGSRAFDDETKGIYGHGFYDGNDLPLTDRGLYINPDLIGGGVKIKLISYFEEGASFISTPFGYEGYNTDLVDNKHYFVVEKDCWLSFLRDYFK